jgi:hypothetical protein
MLRRVRGHERARSTEPWRYQMRPRLGSTGDDYYNADEHRQRAFHIDRKALHQREVARPWQKLVIQGCDAASLLVHDWITRKAREL